MSLYTYRLTWTNTRGSSSNTAIIKIILNNVKFIVNGLPKQLSSTNVTVNDKASDFYIYSYIPFMFQSVPIVL